MSLDGLFWNRWLESYRDTAADMLRGERLTPARPTPFPAKARLPRS